MRTRNAGREAGASIFKQFENFILNQALAKSFISFGDVKTALMELMKAKRGFLLIPQKIISKLEKSKRITTKKKRNNLFRLMNRLYL